MKTFRVTVTIVLDCVDLTVDIVGHQDLTAKGPEAQRHYSWSFNAAAPPLFTIAMSVTVPAPSTVQTGPFSHVAIMLKPNVPTWSNVSELWVEQGAPERRKRRDDTSRELKDVSALCDENVARGEPGRRGLNWSDSQVFFHGGTNGTRDRRHRRDIPLAVDSTEILAELLGREHHSRDSGHAVGPFESGKGSWIGGVKHSCER